VHATVPTLDRFAPIGDQSRNSVPELFDYHRRLVLEARQLTTDEEARSMASWWLDSISVPRMTQGFNSRYDLLPAGTGGTPPSALVYLAEGAGHLFARSDWGKDAMWLSFVAGPYNESHAHQEQGGFTLFARDWLAVTENIWSHSGIQQGTPVHNVVRFERADPDARQCAAPRGDVVVHQCETPQSPARLTVPPPSDGRGTGVAGPAPGFPACPEHGEKGTIFRQLDATANADMTLTESFAMLPTAAVSGYYFSHPQSQYFVVGRVSKEQVEDYAKRKGATLAQAERWLASNLDYDPE